MREGRGLHRNEGTLKRFSIAIVIASVFTSLIKYLYMFLLHFVFLHFLPIAFLGVVHVSSKFESKIFNVSIIFKIIIKKKNLSA